MIGCAARRYPFTLRLPLVLGLGLLAGCTAPLRQPVRAIWVARSDFRTADDVQQIMENCHSAGFNTVLFQVRGNATAFYHSNIEPWAEELGGRDPGWDPLAVAIDAAHTRHMQLHAWVNLMPAWRGPQPPTHPNQVYNAHPDWLWVDDAGQRQPLVVTIGNQSRSNYVSLNPCLPEVRRYLLSVCRDLVNHYNIDGLHLDYVRFPNEPWLPGHKAPDYPHDPRTLGLFRAATGYTPEENPEAWKRWRTDQVTRLVREIHDMLRWHKRSVVLTAAINPVREYAMRTFEDGRRWADERMVDAVVLTDFTDEPADYGRRLAPWVAEKPAVPIVAGVAMQHAGAQAGAKAPGATREQLDIARNLTGNFALFAYDDLFGSTAPSETGAGTADAAHRTGAERKKLLDYLRALP
jgi:uncharacterized lipoprotein YddW (UPF0748 family)